ncbi:hypothetical protein SASPL_106888 [Salvia splendens]|uniref:Uncharacterized protein n=1 Tax=Salvia splendens TaxID=180675 RepID=A0A8X9A6S7_SALSN|nr:protein NRT1/ PTR FAMILY 5.11-like [Salvia splendens]KAG6428849.1 hypothetical protein SASPL_106888 [Salvia splendens]
MFLMKEVLRMFSKHIIDFKKSILFILGLIWSFKMVEQTFVNILITRLATENNYDLLGSVGVVNLLELLYVLLILISSYASNRIKVYKGRFFMVVFSTTFFFIGLIHSFAEAGNDDEWQLSLGLFYPAMAIMAFGRGALAVTLKAFLDDQFRSKYGDDNERQQHTKFWWSLVSSLAALFVQVSPLTGFDLKKLEKVLIVVMGCFFLVFTFGFDYYSDDKERKHNVTSIAKVKRPVNILALWGCLSVLSIVFASGSTFFFLEAITLSDREYIIPVILLLDNLTRFTGFVVSESCSLVIIKLKEQKRYNIQKMELVRIGMGMWCCVLCCNFAVGVSTHRKYGAGGSKMSVYWLTPQFFLLGLVRGLAKDGFQSLYESQVRKYGWALGELARGVGCLLSILCIRIFSGKNFKWFQNNVDTSSLNKYYSFLAVLSVANAMLYCWIAGWYLAQPFLGKLKQKRGGRVMDSRMHNPEGSSGKYDHDDKKMKDKSW